MPSSTQNKKYTSQSVNVKRQQQRNTQQMSPARRSASPSPKRNTNKQATKEAWKSLTSEIKDIMHEMDGETPRKSLAQRQKTSSTARRNVQTRQQMSRSYEGRGSSEGTYGVEGRRSSEGMQSSEGRGSSEGTASYEGTEFHPQGHRMQKKPTVSSRKKSVKKATAKPNLHQNIVNAVIYKEILDQPRSKRPIR